MKPNPLSAANSRRPILFSAAAGGLQLFGFVGPVLPGGCG
jgi:hypothetical protein